MQKYWKKNFGLEEDSKYCKINEKKVRDFQKLNKNSATGLDSIHNQFLKKSPNLFCRNSS
jgi:hypothetical protein